VPDFILYFFNSINLFLIYFAVNQSQILTIPNSIDAYSTLLFGYNYVEFSNFCNRISGCFQFCFNLLTSYKIVASSTTLKHYQCISISFLYMLLFNKSLCNHNTKNECLANVIKIINFNWFILSYFLL